MNNEALNATVFMRHQRPLRALMLEDQPWFSVRDLGVLIGHDAEHYAAHRLDPDLRQKVRLQTQTGEEDAWIVSEGGFFFLLTRYRHPENRSLRQWLSNEVLPALRDAQQHNPHLPQRRMEQLEGQQMSVMDWQGKLWVRWSDAVRMMEDQARSLH